MGSTLTCKDYWKREGDSCYTFTVLIFYNNEPYIPLQIQIIYYKVTNTQANIVINIAAKIIVK